MDWTRLDGTIDCTAGKDCNEVQLTYVGHIIGIGFDRLRPDHTNI